MCRLAGLNPAAVIVEVMKMEQWLKKDLEFSKKFDLKIGTIADLINYRIINEKTVNQNWLIQNMVNLQLFLIKTGLQAKTTWFKKREKNKLLC